MVIFHYDHLLTIIIIGKRLRKKIKKIQLHHCTTRASIAAELLRIHFIHNNTPQQIKI